MDNENPEPPSPTMPEEHQNKTHLPNSGSQESQSVLPFPKSHSTEECTDFLYNLDDVPPWYICILSGFQHFLLTFTGTIPLPGLIADLMCIPPKHEIRSFLLATIIFGGGIATYLQTTFGIRLPIVQGFTFSFYVATSAILGLPQWKCPEMNQTLADSNPKMYDDVWMPRMREIQGAIIGSTLIMCLLAAIGVIGLLVRFVTPLTILATNTLIGLSALDSTIHMSQTNWSLAAISLLLLLLFSQYMREINVPLPGYKRDTGCGFMGYPLFNVFPILLVVVIMWTVCYILTATDVLPPGDPSRTDANQAVLDQTPWFQVPYPFEYGIPTFSLPSIVGMMAGVVAVTIEVIGNYQVCANLLNLPQPPMHAISRGVFFEAIGCIIMGLLGAGNGTTTHSENMGAICLTRVASRRVIQTSAGIMIGIAVITKISALFTIVPPPIMGAIYVVEFAMVVGVGIHNVHNVNLYSSRNLFIIGISLFLGQMLPAAIAGKPNAVRTGSELLDQILTVLLSTGMLIGGLTGAILDNTIPGTPSELRHISKGNQKEVPFHPCYDLPWGMACIQKWNNITSHIPLCPTFSPPDWWNRGCSSICRKANGGQPQTEHALHSHAQYDNPNFTLTAV